MKGNPTPPDTSVRCTRTTRSTGTAPVPSPSSAYCPVLAFAHLWHDVARGVTSVVEGHVLPDGVLERRPRKQTDPEPARLRTERGTEPDA